MNAGFGTQPDSLDAALGLAGQARSSERRCVAFLTSFGGHEQMLLLHIARSAERWAVSVVAERAGLAEELEKRLPRNARLLSKHVLPAHPSLRSLSLPMSVLAALKVVRSLPRPLHLVATGDIGNFYMVTVLLACERALPAVYVPMAPPTENLATRIARKVIGDLVTISPAELRRFRPPADRVLANLAPGHLKRLRRVGDGDVFELFWIGRLEEQQKKPLMALEIMRLLGAHHPDLAVRLNFVGDGPALNEVRSRAAVLGVDARVHFWGWIDFDAPIPSTIPPIHALLNTSDYEGVPLTMLDALELGIPCLFRAGVISDPAYRARLHEWVRPCDAATALASLARARKLGR